MPSLRELQDAFRRSIVERDDLDAAAWIRDDGIEPDRRLSVYRNTFASTLIRAMRLSCPAVDRLVGGEFFDASVRAYITTCPPHSSYLDELVATSRIFSSNMRQRNRCRICPTLPGSNGR
ncbi:DNA-binding domain-containing protein [Burkholderia glumae]|uniref:HvfC/BufC N-terminal domain-containing protein n=1 Tax=Burkholderia glumae TaxID=337 RepID=UPI001F477CC3|nr:DNA-binding domain-containing protein [Burkholderia glumae]